MVEPTWAIAFREAVYRETLSYDFTYFVAITKIKTDGSIEAFKNEPLFLNNLSDNGKHKVKIDFLSLEKIMDEIFREEPNTTLEANEIGRFMQLIRAAGLKVSK